MIRTITAMISAMMAIVRVFIGPPLGSMRPGSTGWFALGIPNPLPAVAGLQSFGSYGSSTPRATRTTRRSG
jgi:hypothetical protein